MFCRNVLRTLPRAGSGVCVGRIAPRTRPQFPRNLGRRYQSTTQSGTNQARPGFQPNDPAFWILGMTSSLLVLSTLYVWYYASGTARLLQVAQRNLFALEQAKSSLPTGLAENGLPSPHKALPFVRTTITTFTPLLPSHAHGTIDSAFDTLDHLLSGPSADAANQILAETYRELREVFEKGAFDADTAAKIKELVEEKSKKLRRLAGDAGQELLDKNPKLAEMLAQTGESAALAEMRRVAGEAGEEGKEILERTYRELRDTLAKAKEEPSTVYRATEMIREKTEELRELARRVAEKVWDETYDSARRKGGVLQKATPEVRKVVEENADELKKLVVESGKVGGVYELWNVLKKYASPSAGTDAAAKLRDYVQGKLRQGSGGGGSIVQTAVTGWEKVVKEYVPGEEGEKIIPQLNGLVELARNKKNEEAKRLVRETVKEVGDVVEKKVGEARQRGVLGRK